MRGSNVGIHIQRYVKIDGVSIYKVPYCKACVKEYRSRPEVRKRLMAYHRRYRKRKTWVERKEKITKAKCPVRGCRVMTRGGLCIEHFQPYLMEAEAA